MLDLIKPLLVETTGPAFWVVLSVLFTFLSFIGVALFVALFSQDRVQANRAHRILRDLLAALTVRRRR